MPRRPRRIDLLIAAAVTAVAQLETWLTAAYAPKGAYAAVAAGMTVPLVWRRSAPIAVLAAVFVPPLALHLADEPFDAAYVMLVLLVAFSTVGAYCDGRRAALGLGAGLVLLAVLLAVESAVGARPEDSVPLADYVFIAGILAAAWALAQVVRQRSERAGELELRAQRLEREQEAQARAAVAEERARIARELHDVVAHSVSVIAVQAGSLRRRLGPERPAEAEELTCIEETAREALGEMRRMLGLLRADDDGASLTPQPGIGLLERLVEQVREAGVRAELRVDGDRRELPRGLDLAAYRIVQEALTNVIKHAGGARARVDVRFGPAELELLIRDDGPGLAAGANGGGHGLVGMRERVALYGGSVRTGAADGGGFVVDARLPISPA